MKMDDAAMDARRGAIAVSKAPAKAEKGAMIPASDIKGVRALMMGLVAKKDEQARRGLLGKFGKGGASGKPS